MPTPFQASRSPKTFRSVFKRAGLALALFAAVNFAAWPILDAARRRDGTRESGVINTARRLEPDVLILGTSRAKHHYDDALLSKLWGRRVYNAGYQAQGMPFARIVYEQVSRRYVPKLVVIDAYTLSSDMDYVHDLDPWYFDSPILRSLDDTGKERCLMCLSLYRFAGHANRVISGAFKTGSEYGVDLIPADRPMDRFEPKGLVKTPPYFIPQLASLVAEIQASGAKVVLCFSPCHSRNSDVPIAAPARQYAKEAGIPFLDFSDPAYAEFNDEKYFRDCGHMNATGARHFTEAFAAEARKYLP